MLRAQKNNSYPIFLNLEINNSLEVAPMGNVFFFNISMGTVDSFVKREWSCLSLLAALQ